MSWLPKTGMNPGAPRSTLRYHLLLTFLGLIMMLPFVWMVLTGLKPLAEVANESWIPSEFKWGNFKEVFSVIPFGRFYWNSLLVASWVTFLQVITSSLAW